MNSMKSGHMSNPLIPPGYQFDEAAGRYRDMRGRFVSYATIFTVISAAENRSGDTIKELSIALLRDQIPASAWYTACAQCLQRIHVQFSVLGAGGIDGLRPDNFRYVDRAVRAEMQRLLAFGVAIAEKSLSEAQIEARVDMYIGSARKNYWALLAKPKLTRTDVLIERRRLGNADHCAWCDYLSKAGWQIVDTLPIPGESSSAWNDGQCLSACHCELERLIIERHATADFIETPLPSKYHRRE